MTENENSVKVAIIGSGRGAGRTIREQMELLVRMDDLEAYRAIGTIEEFKALKEKADLYEQAFYLLLKDDCKRLPEGWTGSIDELYVGRKQFYLDKVEKTKVLGKIKT